MINGDMKMMQATLDIKKTIDYRDRLSDVIQALSVIVLP
jgi:hypothetical protein